MMNTQLIEQQIIACLLVNYDKNESLIEYLAISDFTNETYKKIYAAIQETQSDNPMVIHSKSKISVSELIEIQSSFFGFEQMEENIKLIKNHAIKKQLNLTLQELVAKDLDIDTYLLEITKLSELKSFTKSKEDVKISDAILQAKLEMEYAKANKHKRIYLPFPKITNKIGALMAGDLCTLGGRTGAGKSAFALQVATEISANHKVVYVTLEMTPVQMARRIISTRTGISTIDQTNGKIDSTDCDMVGLLAEEYVDSNLLFSNEGRTTKQVVKLIKKHKPSLVIIDSVNLMFSQGESERIKLVNLTRELKQIALEFKIPIMMLCQLNRGADKTAIPSLSEIKESASVEEDSDQCLLLGWIRTTDDLDDVLVGNGMRNEPAACTSAEFQKINKDGHRFEVLNIAKNRNGAIGLISMKCIASKYIFEEL